MQSRITSRGKLKNIQWKAQGRPAWWAYAGRADEANRLKIAVLRGDERLDCVVDVPPGTQVTVGVGHHIETLATLPVEVSEEYLARGGV